MAVYVTGDTHGVLARFKDDFYNENVKSGDYVIIAGDAGILFTRGPEYTKLLRKIRSLDFTLLWIDGNHENHDWIDSLPVTLWNGGKVHKITDNCYHLMRGQVYNIEGSTFFTMGGADSIDKEWRVEGLTWWKREMPSYEECNEALDNLAKYNNKVDYIITHAAPDNILYQINPSFIQDNLTHFLYEIEKNIEFKHWYFGHYHDQIKFKDGKHTLLYYDTKKVCDSKEKT